MLRSLLPVAAAFATTARSTSITVAAAAAAASSWHAVSAALGLRFIITVLSASTAATFALRRRCGGLWHERLDRRAPHSRVEPSFYDSTRGRDETLRTTLGGLRGWVLGC